LEKSTKEGESPVFSKLYFIHKWQETVC